MTEHRAPAPVVFIDSGPVPFGLSLMWLGIDDTDGAKGGCTTALVHRLRIDGAVLRSLPRLVRLNPAVPWKTRGNGAVALELGKDRGRGETVSSAPEGLWRFDPGAPSLSWERAGEVLDAAARLVGREWRSDDERTHPGVVLLPERPDPSFYWRAVRTLVKKADAEAVVRGSGGLAWGLRSGRGIIGATAAAAWPGVRATYECLAYRRPEKVGTPRSVDRAAAEAVEREVPGSFHTLDREEGHVCAAPSSPCPVLWGVRGTDADVTRALDILGPERWVAWTLFLTNQATDDHLLPLLSSEPVPATSLGLEGTVMGPPRILRGGHVVFRIEARAPTVASPVPMTVWEPGLAPFAMDAIAYEPSKRLAPAARALREGDVVQVWGTVREAPRGLNLERLRVISAPPGTVLRPPICPSCGRRMEAVGAGRPYRCRRCRTRAPPDTAPLPREVDPGWYEPTVQARRHLYRPLRLYGIDAAD